MKNYILKIINRIPSFKVLKIYFRDRLSYWKLLIRKKINTNREPFFYIHIGPGKTGTSVIQNWSINNVDFLAKNDIYYPAHSLDSNGVSGGHQLLILSQSDNGWYVDKNKVTKLLKEVKARKEKHILLSSERFWQYLDELIECFPNAKFIFYIRSSLDHFESGYNQQVKRNNLTAPIADRFKNFSPLPYASKKLVETVEKRGLDRFHIRLYDRDLFKHSNILYDFFEAIFNLTPTNIIIKNVNSSYCLEALEFKRFINQYKLEEIEMIKLDQVLQRYEDGNFNYTLIPRRIYSQFKIRVVKKTIELFDKLKINSKQRELFIENIERESRYEVYEQVISEGSKENIFSFIKKENAMLEKALRKKILNNNRKATVKN